MLHQDTTSSGKTHGVLWVCGGKDPEGQQVAFPSTSLESRDPFFSKVFLSEEPVPVVGPGVEHLCSHGRSMPGIPRYLLVPRWTGSGAEG